MKTTQRILMVAAENGALKGAKVGGMADVLRDVPPALVELGCGVSTLHPSHGFLHELPGAERIATVPFQYGLGGDLKAELYRVPSAQTAAGVVHYVLHHERFTHVDKRTGRFRVYSDDQDDHPFAVDASKFAAFCAAAASALIGPLSGTFDILHLHDWHACFLFALRAFDRRFEKLRPARTVLTIHNLSLQGIRPFKPSGSTTGSAFETWYPWLRGRYDEGRLGDPRWPHCFNPMATGIRMADAIHVVSPSYVEEIIRPSVPERGFIGGEGLEATLKAARGGDRLFGILNGTQYPDDDQAQAGDGATDDKLRTDAGFLRMADVLIEEVKRWREADGENSAHELAIKRLQALREAKRRPALILASVSRIVDQKVALMFTEGRQYAGLALDCILDQLPDRALYIFLGSGLPDSEAALRLLVHRHPNFVFLNGFSEAVAGMLYDGGDLFLMPSSFEPCGVTQMMAMRSGQPCVVHAVGGLRDTVEDGRTGFAFEGKNLREQADEFVRTVLRAQSLALEKPADFEAMRDEARAARFRWSDTAREYIAKLYDGA